MQTGTDSGQGKYLDWAVPNNNNEKDKGVYVDRAKDVGYGWNLIFLIISFQMLLDYLFLISI